VSRHCTILSAKKKKVQLIIVKTLSWLQTSECLFGTRLSATIALADEAHVLSLFEEPARRMAMRSS
jgi:hypothetical protein